MLNIQHQIDEILNNKEAIEKMVDYGAERLGSEKDDLYGREVLRSYITGMLLAAKK